MFFSSLAKNSVSRATQDFDCVCWRGEPCILCIWGFACRSFWPPVCKARILRSWHRSSAPPVPLDRKVLPRNHGHGWHVSLQRPSFGISCDAGSRGGLFVIRVSYLKDWAPVSKFWQAGTDQQFLHVWIWKPAKLPFTTLLHCRSKCEFSRGWPGCAMSKVIGRIEVIRASYFRWRWSRQWHMLISRQDMSDDDLSAYWNFLENKLLLTSINFTLKTSNPVALQKNGTSYVLQVLRFFLA